MMVQELNLGVGCLKVPAKMRLVNFLGYYVSFVIAFAPKKEPHKFNHIPTSTCSLMVNTGVGGGGVMTFLTSITQGPQNLLPL